ncbi:MAG: ABC transporter substrate-binding protein [Eubacterium sp.]
MTKKYLSLILSAVLIISVFTACTAQQSTDEHKLVTQTTTEISADTTSFKLSYSQSDSLDPFESETLNNQIVEELVFDSLFTLDESFEAQPNIATSYSYTDNTTLTVTIPSGIQFSDGGTLTAKNVVSSFYKAKDSPHWKNSLKSIDSASTVSDTVIKFKLSYANPNAHNLLTFAVSNGKTDKAGYSIGSGRYKFAEGSGEVYIEVNKNYRKDFNPHFTKILLINITSGESIENAVNIGNISYAFRDLSTGSKVRIQSNKKAVNLNNLVYIGINQYSGITSNEYIRRAISLAIDRDTLVKSAYQGYAKSAVSVFNSASKLGKQTQIFSSVSDTAAAKQAIAQSGYESSELKIDILVNNNSNKYSAAQLIKQQLETAGFKVTINKEKNASYQNKVKNRNFNIYIGETKIPNDMNLSSFFTSKGATRYGIKLDDSAAVKSYNGYLKSKNEIGRFVLAFSEEMPFIPLLYRQGMICYSKSMHGDMQGYTDNYFSNIEDWYYN